MQQIWPYNPALLFIISSYENDLNSLTLSLLIEVSIVEESQELPDPKIGN